MSGGSWLIYREGPDGTLEVKGYSDRVDAEFAAWIDPREGWVLHPVPMTITFVSEPTKPRANWFRLK